VIREFLPEDYFAIKDPIDCFPEEVTEENIKEAMQRGVCVTGIDDDGTVLGCGGAIITGENEAELWVRLSRKSENIKFKVIDIVCAGMRVITESLKGFTFTCKVAEGFKVGERFATWLKFQKTDESVTINNVRYLIYRL
jgi:hypothetical protein